MQNHRPQSKTALGDFYNYGRSLNDFLGAERLSWEEAGVDGLDLWTILQGPSIVIEIAKRRPCGWLFCIIPNHEGMIASNAGQCASWRACTMSVGEDGGSSASIIVNKPSEVPEKQKRMNILRQLGDLLQLGEDNSTTRDSFCFQRTEIKSGGQGY